MIALIAAYAKNRVIGCNGKIPWTMKGEQQRFKELTTGKIVIMGRKTFDEIGKPLPNRITYLVSGTAKYQFDNLIVVSSLKEALEKAGEQDVYISGGGKLYEEALSIVDRMYLTVIEKEYDGDTYFPTFNENDFIKTYEERIDGEIPYTYYTFERNPY